MARRAKNPPRKSGFATGILLVLVLVEGAALAWHFLWTGCVDAEKPYEAIRPVSAARAESANDDPIRRSLERQVEGLERSVAAKERQLQAKDEEIGELEVRLLILEKQAENR
jgi:hypothetical protein